MYYSVEVLNHSKRIMLNIRSIETTKSVDYLYFHWKYEQSTDFLISSNLLLEMILHMRLPPQEINDVLWPCSTGES